MLFLSLQYTQATVYAEFELQSDKEKDFFNRLSPFNRDTTFTVLPKTLQLWLNNSLPSALLLHKGESQRNIHVLFNTPYSHNFHLAAPQKPLFELLDFLYKNNITETNDKWELEEYLAALNADVSQQTDYMP
jgi:hypothetical protein